MLLSALIFSFVQAGAIPTAVDEIVREALKSHPAAGISVAVAKDGKIVCERGYGYADLENEVPATPSTVFHADSITKHLTAGLMLKLASEGKISLSQDIGLYVPALAGRGITLEELLSHESGLCDYSNLPEFAAKEREEWPQAEIVKLIASNPPAFAPGESFSYCNSGFYLAGLVIEKVTGKSWDAAMQEGVYGPLGMTHTRQGFNEPLIPKRARGYDLDGKEIVNASPISWQPVFSAGSATTTAGDLLRYEIGLQSGRLISKTWLQKMISPHQLGGAAIDYGLGARLGQLESHRCFGHTGGGGGFNNLLITFPDDHLSIVVLTNLDGGGLARAVAGSVARKLLGLPVYKLQERPMDPSLLTLRYGTYRTDEGPLELFIKDGQVRRRPKGDPSDGDSSPYLGQDRFFAGDDTYVQMLRQNGVVTWLFLYQDGLLMDAYPRIGD